MSTSKKSSNPPISFKTNLWDKGINVRDFIFQNISPYDGDFSFLEGPSQKTKILWEKAQKLLAKERDNKGILDIDTKTISTITSHKSSYIDKDLEVIVGFQTDEPLKRAIKPFGGWRVVAQACEENGYKLDEEVVHICRD